jgi:Domain of unknown function (DUF1844)
MLQWEAERLSRLEPERHGETTLAQEKHDDTFRVVDRRLFTSEGELRKEALEWEKREEKAEAAALAAQQAAAVETKAAEELKPAEKTPKKTAKERRSLHGFQHLVDFLARNAAAMLGGMADPRTGQPFFDLESARELVDMLDALRETTEGNLSTDDEQMLLEVIGSVKLSFVEVKKAMEEAQQRAAKSAT